MKFQNCKKCQMQNSQNVLLIQQIFQKRMERVPFESTSVTVFVQLDRVLDNWSTCLCLFVRTDSAATFELALRFWQLVLIAAFPMRKRYTARPWETAVACATLGLLTTMVLARCAFRFLAGPRPPHTTTHHTTTTRPPHDTHHTTTSHRTSKSCLYPECDILRVWLH